MRSRLRFENKNDLVYDVHEVVTRSSFGKKVTTTYYTGFLLFATGVEEGWWFMSSDDSIKWFLGPRVRDAMKELRRRYQGEQRKSKRDGARVSRKRRRRVRQGSRRVRESG